MSRERFRLRWKRHQFSGEINQERFQLWWVIELDVEKQEAGHDWDTNRNKYRDKDIDRFQIMGESK